MRFLYNAYDLEREDALYNVLRRDGQTQQEAYQEYKALLSDKIIGKPQATEKYTVEQLEYNGLVGVYTED